MTQLTRQNWFKNGFLLLCIAFFSFSFHAQQKSCGTDELFHKTHKNDPKFHRAAQEIEQLSQDWIQRQSMGRYLGAPSIITIPVVVHVLHNGEAEGTGANISLARIQQQIDILNEDFRSLNADSLAPSHPFYGLGADCQINFCLAQRDPYGYSSNGVTRTLAGQSTFSVEDNEKIKSTEKGGKDNWNPTQYLNIWVFNPSPTNTVIGWSSSPAEMSYVPEWDGIVIQNTAFGISASNLANYNKGRTATHEIGHWLNLLHPWGDSEYLGCRTDNVSDTPPSEGPNTGCKTFPWRANNLCGSDANGEMFMNFMDYTNQDCMNMFTAGQATRMQACLNTTRASLLTSQGCVPSVISNPLASATRWFVDANATGNKNGTSWANACTSLPEALRYALDFGVEEIWVKKGNYLPTDNGDRNEVFLIPNGVKIYGGFAGTESLLSDRNAALIHSSNQSILSGDLNGDDAGFTNNDENSYNVVKFSFAPNTTLLNGFTITGGNNNVSAYSGFGGGISNQGSGKTHSSNPVLSNCIITYNSAYQGGGLFNHGGEGEANMTISDCIFSYNRAVNGLGGALFNNGLTGLSSPTISNTKFLNNTAPTGGAVLNEGSLGGICEAVFTNCEFTGNTATFSGGGAVYNWGVGDGDTISGLSSPIFVNCSFTDNKALSNGSTAGAVYNNADGGGNASPVFKNSTFLNNQAYSGGSALSNYSSQNGNSSPVFTHCSFYKNTTIMTIHATLMHNYASSNSTTNPDFSNCVFFDNGPVPVRNYDDNGTGNLQLSINYSLIDPLMNGYSGSNNINSDYLPFVSETDLHLRSCSPGIDIASNALATAAGISSDIEGNPRVVNGTTDAGAYEAASSSPSLSISPSRGTALSFSGTNQSVATINVLSPKTNQLTAEAWVKLNALPTGEAAIWYHGTAAANGYGLFVNNAGNIIVKHAGSSIATTSSAITPGTWQHIAYVLDNTDGTLFINGINAGTIASLPSEPSGKFILGGYTDAYFSGEMDEIRFWESARSETEIRENMHLILDGSQADLKNYFQCNESNTASMLVDGVGCGLAQVLGATRIVSQANVSTGTSFTITNPAAATDYLFTGTNLKLNFGNSPGTGQLVVSKLAGIPTGNQLATSFPFNDYYWVVNNFCQNKTGLNTTASITMAANSIFAADQSNPSQLKFNQRNVNSAGSWANPVDAGSADSGSGEIVFTALDSLNEFVISNSFHAIVLSTDTLEAFSSCFGAVSAEQSYSLSAQSLTADAVLTASSGFEISSTSGAGFASSLNLTPTSGTIGSTTIYVRQKSNATNGTSGSVVHSSTGNLSKTIVIPASSVRGVSLSGLTNPVVYTSASTMDLVFTSSDCSPSEYSIAAVNPAQLPNFVAVNNAVFSSSPLTINLPSGLNPGTYTFELSVSNAGSSATYPFSLTVIDYDLASRRGNAMSFNGTDQIMRTTRLLSSATNNFTMETWVKIEQIPSQNTPFIYNGSNSNGYGIGITNVGQLMIYTGASSSQQSTYFATLNTWFHVALVSSGSNAELFVNGVSIGTFSNSVTAPTGNFKIGGNDVSFFKGQLDEIRFWNTPRSIGEIRENMHLTLPDGAANLIAYYQFNESSPQAYALDNVGGNSAVNYGANWLTSSANVSKGVSFTHSNLSAATDYSFTGTQLSLNFGNSPGSGNVVVSRLDGLPAGTQITSDIALFDNRYWVVNNFAATKTNLNISAKIDLNAGDITAYEEANPGVVLLSQRAINSAGDWNPAVGANSASSSLNQAVFSSNSAMLEFAVGKSMLLLPTVSISANDADNYVPDGATITFTALTSNGGSTPTYQWKINGVNVGSNSATFATANLQNNDQVSLSFSTTGSGISTNTVQSNVLTMKTYPFVFTTNSSKNAMCAGDTTVLTTSILVNDNPINNLWSHTPVNLNGSSGVSNNITWFTKVVIPNASTSSKLWLALSSAPPAATNVRLALYGSNGTNPGALLVESGAKNNLQSGLNYFPIAETALSAGTYWVAFITDNFVTFKSSNTVTGENIKASFVSYASGFQANFSSSFMNTPNVAYGFGVTVPEPNYSWSPSDSLDTAIGDTVNAFPAATRAYTVSMTDEYGNTRSSSSKTVNISNNTGSSTVSACVSYVWNSQSYTTSGVYVDTLTNVAGCDSIATLHLTINTYPVADSPANVTACDSYTLPALTVGNYFTGSGGTGTALFAGNVISSSQTIYVYAANGVCTDENSFTLTVYDCSQLAGPSCGATLSNLTDALHFDLVAGATNYRFLVEHTPTAFAAVSTKGNGNDNLFRLSWLGAAKYGTSYTVKVSAFVGGSWQPYGNACTVTTPPTRLTASSCGAVLTNLTDAVNCFPVAGATNYRFLVTHAGSAFNKISYSNSATNAFFRMSWFSSGVQPGTTYTVQAAAYVGGSWQTYGPSCTITTPSQLTQLKTASCNVNIPALSTALYSDKVTGASNYRYEVVNVATGFSKVSTRNAADTLFRLSWVSGIQLNTTYTVRVSAYLNGVWQAYGPACTVTTPAAIMANDVEVQEHSNGLSFGEELRLETYPNPNNGEFTIRSSHEGRFDIINELGQLIQTLEITKENAFQTQVEGLGAGVYFVTGTINNEVITKKVMVIR